ncbi:MAG TPA: hypothetical protein VKR59_21480 [Terriglobales bacterium]|nr:hypothetical protein [Terriglobales bacterium]
MILTYVAKSLRPKINAWILLEEMHWPDGSRSGVREGQSLADHPRRQVSATAGNAFHNSICLSNPDH